jgi:hypothetical protein
MEKETKPEPSYIEPTLIFSVLCDDIRREDNGKFILIGLFEIIGSKSFPVVHPTMFIMNCWSGGMGVFKQKTRILDHAGKIIAEDGETSFTLPDMRSKHRVIARFNNLRFDAAGEYAVEVLGNGELKLRYPLVVKQVQG